MHTAPASGRRPSELDDRDWLQRRYQRDGDMAIALELHVSRKAVRLARERHGIVSRARGRRRGDPVAVAGPTPATAGQLIAERLQSQSRANGPAPSRQLLASRTRALSEAFTDGSAQDIRAALIELAAGCGLVHDHLARLEAA